jgi:hypothetical protein
MIEINEDNLIEEFKKLSENCDVEELYVFFGLEEGDIVDNDKLKLIENFDFNQFKNLKRFKVTVPDFLDDISNFILSLSQFLSNVPYGLEKVEINFDSISMQDDFCDDFYANMILFISKIYNTVTHFKFCINFAGYDLNKELTKFKNLIHLELRFQCIGDLIGKRLRRIIINNKELKTFTLLLLEINNCVPKLKKIDSDDWFLNLSFCISKHKKLNNLNIIWNISSNDTDSDVIIKELVKKYYIKDSLKYINKNKQIDSINVLIQYSLCADISNNYLKNICKKYIDRNQAENNL